MKRQGGSRQLNDHDTYMTVDTDQRAAINRILQIVTCEATVRVRKARASTESANQGSAEPMKEPVSATIVQGYNPQPVQPVHNRYNRSALRFRSACSTACNHTATTSFQT